MNGLAGLLFDLADGFSHTRPVLLGRQFSRCTWLLITVKSTIFTAHDVVQVREESTSVRNLRVDGLALSGPRP